MGHKDNSRIRIKATLLFQDLNTSLVLIIELISLSLFFLAVLAINQLPTVLSSERVASIVSVTTAVVFACSLFLISKSKCAALMFALLLAVHAMLPISRLTSFVVSGPLFVIYIAFYVADHHSLGIGQILQEVSRIFLYVV